MTATNVLQVIVLYEYTMHQTAQKATCILCINCTRTFSILLVQLNILAQIEQCLQFCLYVLLTLTFKLYRTTKFCENCHWKKNKLYAGGRHTMPPPQGRQAAARSGRWRRLCCRPFKLSSDLNRQPKQPSDLDLWPFDLESGVRVTCDVGYLCANFSLPRPLCSRLSPDVNDRQTDDRQTDVRQTDVRQHHRYIYPRLLGAGYNNW